MNLIIKNIIRRFRGRISPDEPKEQEYPIHVKIMSGSRISHDTIIQDYTYIGYNCTITKAIIGRYCSIADNVSIGPGEHDLSSISTSTLFCEEPYQLLTLKDCIVGNDVWIGVDSIIRRGVRIGNGAVIGANSFVNFDVPDFAIVAGNPAKIIRYRFSPVMIEKITNSQWWNYELEESRIIIDKLTSEKW